MAGNDDKEKRGFSGLSDLVSDISDANLPLSAKPQDGGIAPAIPDAMLSQPKQTLLTPVSGNPSPNGEGGETQSSKFLLLAIIIGVLIYIFLPLVIFGDTDKKNLRNRPQAASLDNTHAHSTAAVPAASTSEDLETSAGQYEKPSIGRDNIFSSGTKSDPETSELRIDSPSDATNNQTLTSLPTSQPLLTYRVVAGDTLAKVATKHGVTVNMLLNANPDIISPDKILVGAWLTIPLPGEALESSGRKKANPSATSMPWNASQVNPPPDVPQIDKIDSSDEGKRTIDSLQPEADLSAKSVDIAIWTTLERGMSKSQVRAILGEPQSIQQSIFETWYYKGTQDNPSPHVIFDEDKLVIWNERGSHDYTAANSKNAIDGVNKPAKTLPTPAWTTLERGMSKSQVRAILGEPQSIQQSIFETWYYKGTQDNPSPHVIFDEDKLVIWNERGSHEYTAANSKNAIDGVNKPAETLLTPASGTIKQYHASESVAPLTIRTRGLGQHYFVKLTEWTTGRLVATVFIRGGQSVDFKMPLGSYKMKYATGATWYGESELFGPDTSYSEADSRFDFEDNGNQFSGYTVELYLQQNGNLETRKIAPSEF